MFLVCCLLTGIAGNIFPFMEWFNLYEYRVSQLDLLYSPVKQLTLAVHIDVAYFILYLPGLYRRSPTCNSRVFAQYRTNVQFRP